MHRHDIADPVDPGEALGGEGFQGEGVKSADPIIVTVCPFFASEAG
jgi:hypothetical protein